MGQKSLLQPRGHVRNDCADQHGDRKMWHELEVQEMQAVKEDAVIAENDRARQPVLQRHDCFVAHGRASC